jgi:hypothetical protein
MKEGSRITEIEIDMYGCSFQYDFLGAFRAHLRLFYFLLLLNVVVSLCLLSSLGNNDHFSSTLDISRPPVHHTSIYSSPSPVYT